MTATSEIKDIRRDGATIYQLDGVPEPLAPEGVNIWWANVDLCNGHQKVEREEIAEFLRVAANSHRALVTALKNMMETQDCLTDCWCDKDNDPCEACAARSVLELAGEPV